MRTGDRIVLGIKLLLPLLLAVLLNLSPQAGVMRDTLQGARVAADNGQYAAAVQHLQKAVDTQLWRGDLWERLGEQSLLAEQYVGAAEAYQKAWLLDAITDEGLENLAQAHLALEEDSRAILAWKERTARGGAGDEIFLALAAAQRRTGDLDGAAATLQLWQEQKPQDSNAAYQLGIHRMLIDPQKAGEMLLLAADLDPDLEEQIAGLTEALETALGEEDAAYRVMLLGRALGQAGEWELAEAAFEQVVQLAPDYGEGWAMLGEAHQQLGGNGLDALEQARELAPESVLVRSLWGLYLRRQGQPEVALTLYSQLAAQYPEEAAWQAEVGHCLSEMGDIISALPYLQKAAALAPQNPFYWQELARFSIGNGIEALEVGLPAARNALALQPDDPAALDLMGWTMMYFHDLPSAERFLQQAVQRDANFVDAHLHLGQLYVQTGQISLAKRHLLQVVGLDAESFAGEVAQRLLNGMNP